MTLVQPGCILIANPNLSDPNFSRCVVYILEHGANGSLGLIVNQVRDERLGDIWEGCPSGLEKRQWCATGGPVDTSRGLLLHAYVDLPGAMPITDDVAIGGPAEALADNDASSFPFMGPRLFLGHAGWSADQLDAEIETGSWLVRQGHPGLLLNPHPPEDLWTELVTTHAEMPAPNPN